MQVLPHDHREGAARIGQTEEGGAEGAQGVGPGGGQQKHHGVVPDCSQFFGAFCRQRVGLMASRSVGVDPAVGALPSLERPQRVVPLEPPPCLPRFASSMAKPSREGEVAGAVADEDEVAGCIVCRPFVEVGLVAVAQPEQASGGQRSPGQIMTNNRDLCPSDGAHAAVLRRVYP